MSLLQNASQTLAVISATSQSGRGILEILAQRGHDLKNVRAFKIGASVEVLPYGNQNVQVEDFVGFDFKNIDIALFASQTENYEQDVQRALDAGCFVIDGPNFFRRDPKVPMIIPEINGDVLKDPTHRIICSSNCAAVQTMVALYPLHKISPIKRIVGTYFLSASGKGFKAREELKNNATAILNEQEFHQDIFPRPLAFNIVPQSDDFITDGYTKGEIDIRHDLGRVFGSEISASITSTRVPVEIGHAASLNVEFEDQISLDTAFDALENFEGVHVSRKNENYKSPLEIAGTDAVYVSRVRRDPSCDTALDLWVTADNLRKGTALNVVQIAELHLKYAKPPAASS